MSDHLAPVWRILFGDDGRARITYVATGDDVGTLAYTVPERIAKGAVVLPAPDDDEPPSAA